MSDQDNMFGNDQAQGGEATSPAAQPSELDTLLANIKNERGEQKYQTPQAALGALEHAQQFIPTLQGELETSKATIAELQEELTRRKSVEEAIENLQPAAPAPAVNPQPGLDQQAAAQLFTQLQEQREIQLAQDQNAKSVVSAMKEKYGDNADKVFYGKGAELGMDASQLNTLAATSPKAVLELFDKVEASAPTVTQGSETIGISQQEKPSSFRRDPEAGSVLFGSTTQGIMEEARAAKKLAEELNAKGEDVHMYADPKRFFAL
jgi:hypothetical protein